VATNWNELRRRGHEKCTEGMLELMTTALKLTESGQNRMGFRIFILSQTASHQSKVDANNLRAQNGIQTYNHA